MVFGPLQHVMSACASIRLPLQNFMEGEWQDWHCTGIVTTRLMHLNREPNQRASIGSGGCDAQDIQTGRSHLVEVCQRGVNHE
jgi:hypothetical protein